MRVAAIDVGTNTVRLLVADVEDGKATHVERDREITRLGQGVDDQRRLDPDAVERTIEVVARFVGAGRDAGAERIRVAGTSALRDATDRESFAGLVADRTRHPLEILTGADEGRLSMLGATSTLPPGKIYVVCDIGGGSTEISTPSASVSLDVGSVRLKERYLRDDPPTPDQLRAARRAVEDALDVTTRLVISGYETFVGVAGTITTLAALVAGQKTYDRQAVHGTVLRRDQVMAWTGKLMSMTTAEIVELGPVEPGRADVLAGGVLILKRTMLRFLFEEVLVSENDILDGLVLDLARAANR